MDLNSDLSEEVGDDAAMFGIVTSANIACGFHAGGPESMLESAQLAAENRVSVGAHPSYRDREGFGRRDQDVEPDELRADILEQLDALTNAADIADVRIRYLKPHGALYNRIVVDARQADAVARAARDAMLPILGLGGTELHLAADRLGVQFFREAFVDRAYRPDGSLVPRSESGSVITDPDEAATRAVRMVEDGTVVAIDGTLVRVRLDSLCVHGDTPGAVAMAERVRRGLVAAGIELRAFA
ncbi:LamB/YcsF family protein [Terrimesophilobacter mesophilus]|uniref:LamB/YcsF family protein n=1 Tax=Terrimesophilobacter mesophilus TaxID=433647 RepID=A0A4R8VF07_9MICO|nr:5-oxoprolinase subunit PxpA [Terrimesophilobacter mesophilus]TFB81415.1 LamB/YcsF family protein [Terrimesophilobacter mesophilus]